MSNPGPRTPSSEAGGFIMLVLLGIIGIGGVGLLFAVQSFAPPFWDVARRVDENVDTVVGGARAAFVRNGTYPASIDAVAAACGLSPDGPWRRDPHRPAQDLDYRVLAAALRVSSRGGDGLLGSADDVVVDVPAEDLVRVRQRARLRLLRAVLLRSAFRSAGTMSAPEVLAMRNAQRDLAVARRSWLTADAATRTVLGTTMATAAATINALVLAHSCPPLPSAMTGAGGLMEQLGTFDARAIDGAGRTMLIDAGLGMIARGYDGIGGTDDDM